MKLLLTGANGFVGSHILDCLRQRKIPTAMLLRPACNRRFIEQHIPEVEVRYGSITDPASLGDAVRDVTHLIHCAGATRALGVSGFHAANQTGTANVVAAINARAGQVRRLVHISSLAACGPATAGAPARETDPPHPISEYGRSKLAAEREVTARCQAEFVIVRPPAVYGPRDTEFLRLFRAVRAGLAPEIAGGRQELSLVYVEDLAGAVVACLEHPAAAGRTYHVAASEVVTSRQTTREIAQAMERHPVRVPLPGWLLPAICGVTTAWARLASQENTLAHDKYRELLAPGWVCDPTRLHTELGVVCSTRLSAGIRGTLAWYRDHAWL